jgi:hypothetical protein
MVFSRSVPQRRFRDYTRYRPQLRRDFRYRCAYCLTHERYLGGEAGYTIDHHRPQRGPYARPDLSSQYANLYWTCRECNDNKSDTWPSPEEQSVGLRFLDPCVPEDDHDLHVGMLPDGSVESLTPAGEYTIEHLMLWRDQLQYHRIRLHTWQQERDELVELLARKKMPPDVRARLEAVIVGLSEYLEPPMFDRPRPGRAEHEV